MVLPATAGSCLASIAEDLRGDGQVEGFYRGQDQRNHGMHGQESKRLGGPGLGP